MNDALHKAVVELLDSADDTGCTDDLIVVSKEKLRALAALTSEGVPDWLL